MDIYINGKLVGTWGGNVREAAQEAEKHLAPGCGFGRAWVDGEMYAGVTSLPEVQDARAGRLDLEMLTADELARQTADSLVKYLDRVVPYVESLSSSLRFGEPGAIERLEALVPAFEYIETAQRGIEVAGALHRQSGSVTSDFRMLQAYLDEVVTALERSDSIQAADVLEYSVLSQLESIRSSVAARCRVMGS